MMHAMRVHKPGGPESLVYETVELPPPGEGEVRIRHTAIGLNYIDVYYRTGAYPAPAPFIPGNEGAGIVLETGPGVTGFRPGDRVAYAATLGGTPRNATFRRSSS